MAIRYYDEALANKIQSWLKDDTIRVLKPDETARLFSMKADDAKDAPIHLPIIALSRDRDIEVLNTRKRPMSYDGMSIRAYDDKTGKEVRFESGFKLNAIPIRLTYQLDIYTRDMVDADEYLRNFVFNFVNYPNVTITLPYNGANIHHESTVYMSSTISDNSDIPQRLFPSQFTRYTIGLMIDNAYLFSIPNKPYVGMGDFTIELKNGNGVENTVETVDLNVK